MKIKFENNNTIVNFSNSIINHFGAKPFHNTIPAVDEVLKGHKKVVVMLFDGLGKHVIEKHLPEDSYMRKHFIHTMEGTFPPTTAASTLGMLTAKFPIETGWIGWAPYFKKYGHAIEAFTSKEFISQKKIDYSGNLMDDVCPTTTIFEIIEKSSKNMVKTLDFKKFPICENGPRSLREAKKGLTKFLQNNDSCFAYFYWPFPDTQMHIYGVMDKRSIKQTKKINKFVEKVTKNNPDTLFFSIADHGMKDIEWLDIRDHADFCDCLEHEFSLEPRAAIFHVKKDSNDKFVDLFKKYYGEYFVLLPREEVLKQKIFGDGKPQKMIDEFLGDYLAISKSKYCFVDDISHCKEIQKGHHAGLTDEERYINISAYNK